jgi:hypothetical protein
VLRRRHRALRRGVRSKGYDPLRAIQLREGCVHGTLVDAELSSWLLRIKHAGARWQATLIGRDELWPVHQRAAELGGMLRTRLEDTFYLSDGARAKSNGAVLEPLAQCARNAGRELGSPRELFALVSGEALRVIAPRARDGSFKTPRSSKLFATAARAGWIYGNGISPEAGWRRRRRHLDRSAV